MYCLFPLICFYQFSQLASPVEAYPRRRNMTNADMHGMIETLEAMLSPLLVRYQQIVCMYCATSRPR